MAVVSAATAADMVASAADLEALGRAYKDFLGETVGVDLLGKGMNPTEVESMLDDMTSALMEGVKEGEEEKSTDTPATETTAEEKTPEQQLADLFKDGRTPTASEIEKWAEAQGWERKQNPDGPGKFVDENGITRATVKKGSSRAPGSEGPHVEVKDETGQRIDRIDGSPVDRKSPGNHRPIDWDLE